jgi:hypothetical protein
MLSYNTGCKFAFPCELLALEIKHGEWLGVAAGQSIGAARFSTKPVLKSPLTENILATRNLHRAKLSINTRVRYKLR